MNFRKILSAVALGALATSAAVAEPTGAPKWLVLNPITYQTGVDRVAFEGIDKLLMNTLVQAKKYKVLDRDMYATAAREQGLGANVEIKPAGYSIAGEIVQIGATGKTRSLAGSPVRQFLATVSLRAYDLQTQQPYEAEMLRVTQYCQTSKDMLVHVVNRTALALLMRDYPLRIMDAEDGELTLNYGSDFLRKGDQFEIRRRKAIVDEDTGDTIYKERVIGVCQITDTGSTTSTAMLVAPCKAKVGDILKFYDGEDLPVVAAPATPAPVDEAPALKVLPRAKPRIAVAPFISKRNGAISINGVSFGARQWMDDCVAHINTCLDQSGSFRTLDRTFGPEVDGELARIECDRNADLNDICRLSKKLAADYLVVAEVVFSDVAPAGIDFASGLPRPPLNANFAEVRYRVVHAPTTELAGCSGTITLNAANFAGTGTQVSSASAAVAAGAIVDAIQAKFDPAEFAKVKAARDAAAAEAAEAARRAAEEAAKIPPPPPGVNVGF